MQFPQISIDTFRLQCQGEGILLAIFTRQPNFNLICKRGTL